MDPYFLIIYKIYIYGEDQIFKRSKLNSPEKKGKVRKMKENKNRYSEYTLGKIKNFIIKNVDKIKLIGGDMYLYFPNKDKFKFLRQNDSIIQYILNDTNNFKTLGEYIVNKNLIKRIEIKSSPCEECSADAFETYF